LSVTTLTRDEIIGIPHRECSSKIEIYSLMVTGRAGNLLQPERHIRLCPQIELHIGVDGKGVIAFLADAPPVTVCSHEPFVDSEAGLFADSAWDRVQATFHLLLGEGDHIESIATKELKWQPSPQSRRDRLTHIRVAIY
jgi:hypothetical protein